MRKLGSSTDSSRGAPARGSTSSASDGAGPRGRPGTVDDTATSKFHDRAANSHHDQSSRARCYHDTSGADSGDQCADHAYDYHSCSAGQRRNRESG